MFPHFYAFLVILTLKSRLILSINLQSSLKMAQCRAHCLNQFVPKEDVHSDKSCKNNAVCFGCWATCEKLSLDFPIWSFNCGQEERCESGCQTACEFVSKHQDKVVPLSHYKSRLTLIFRGNSALWSLKWDRGVPPQHAVFALFTKSSRMSWKSKLQTADLGCSLEGVPSGSDMKLVAVSESGLLSVIITPFDPPDIHQKGIGNKAADQIFPNSEYVWTQNVIGDTDVTTSWMLFYEASVEKSGLVAAKIWWGSQRPFGSDYLVTWEVAGGGLKGHLYTDLPEVELTLWPETVYKVQVEVVSRPLSDTRASEPLILDTHNITIQVRSSSVQEVPSQPLIKPYAEERFQIEVVIGAVCGACAALLLISIFVYWRRTRAPPSLNESSSSSSKLTLDRSISDLTFEQSLIHRKSLGPTIGSYSVQIEPSPKVARSSLLNVCSGNSLQGIPPKCHGVSATVPHFFNPGAINHQHCHASSQINPNQFGRLSSKRERPKAKISVI